MMIKRPVVLLMVWLLAACSPQPESPKAPKKEAASQSSSQKAEPPPFPLTTENLATALPPYSLLPEKQTFYYNAQGERVNDPSPNGYYREVLGKTTNGQLVVQDFFQNEQQAQTMPFLVVPNADPQIFNNSINDSRVVWYKRGSNKIRMVMDFNNGESTKVAGFYVKDRLFATINEQPTHTEITYYGNTATTPQGRFVLVPHSDPQKPPIVTNHIFYYDNGQKMLEGARDEQGRLQDRKAWDEQGKSIEPDSIKAQTDLALANLQNVMNTLAILMAE